MRVAGAVAAISFAVYAQAPPTPATYRASTDQRRAMEQKASDLEAALKPLRQRVPDDLLVDAEVYLKAAQRVLRFEEFYSSESVEQTLAVLGTGLERAHQLAQGPAEWTKRTGSFSRGYRSRVDDSVQPYSVTIPAGYNGTTPEPLEVVLHGRGSTLTEVSFLHAHDAGKAAPADHDFIQLDVFGRGNNAYRWAGETDVFEAIDSVKKRYRIDPERIVLRGFSMGGAGAWHLGLHYPDRWAAVEAGAGFVETKVHGGVAAPPPYAHIYDALDYALNAVNLPMVGYGGEDDPQLRASLFIREELQREGYRFQPQGLNYSTEDLRSLFLVGRKTQHRWHPESKKESDAFIARYEAAGIEQQQKVRFVTYTERYNRCRWITIDQLERPYERAQIDSERNGSELMVTTRNVARVTIRGSGLAKTLRVDGQLFPAEMTSFERAGGKWRVASKSEKGGKAHGLQGPIDDAFMEPFLCVRPAAAAGKSAVDDFARLQLDRFSVEFARWMRGEVRVKAATEVSAGDVRSNNIVAFGTPATSALIAHAMHFIPIRWTAEEIIVGSQRFDAATHMLSAIYPNPDNHGRYMVINSGHTFHEADFKGTNALLYPRVGDWAVTDVRTGRVVAEGVFDRNWKLP